MILLDDTIELPGQMFWADETEWTPVDQQEGYSVTGSLMLDVSERLAGRPMTLGGRDYTCWVTRETVLALNDLAAIPKKEMNIVLEDGRLFKVRFSYKDSKPVEARPIYDRVPQQSDDPYTLKLKFIIVG